MGEEGKEVKEGGGEGSEEREGDDKVCGQGRVRDGGREGLCHIVCRCLCLGRDLMRYWHGGWQRGEILSVRAGGGDGEEERVLCEYVSEEALDTALKRLQGMRGTGDTAEDVTRE